MFSPYIARGRSLYRGASAAQLTCATNLPSSQNFSMCGWAVRKVDRGAYEMIACRANSTTAATDAATISVSSVDTFNINDFHSADINFGTTYKIGEPFFWALIGASSTMDGYGRRVGETVLQNAHSGVGAASFSTGAFILGNDDTGANEWWDGEIWNVRTWTGQLTKDEILRESLSSRPKRLQGLHAWWPIEGTNPGFLNDWSGNGNHLAKVGSGTLRAWTLPYSLLDPLPMRGSLKAPAAAGGGAVVNPFSGRGGGAAHPLMH